VPVAVGVFVGVLVGVGVGVLVGVGATGITTNSGGELPSREENVTPSVVSVANIKL
jgi:hypothetical protein